MNNLTINFLLLAAGQGQRFGQAVNKLLYKYNGEVIFSRLWRRLTEYINVYYRNPEIFRRRLQQEAEKLSCPPTKKAQLLALSAQINLKFRLIIATRKEERELFSPLCYTENPVEICFVDGSLAREATAIQALRSINLPESSVAPVTFTPAEELFFIHDAARLQVSDELLDRLLINAWLYHTAIPMLPLSDSVVYFNAGENNKPEHLDRSRLFALQTPQVFSSAALSYLLSFLPPITAENKSFYEHFTDDSSLYAAYGGDIRYVKGEENNFKLTSFSDLERLK